MKHTHTYHHQSALWGVLCTIFLLSNSVRAATLIDQDFNQQDGPLISAEGSLWEHRSGTEADLMVQDGQLIITSSASEDAGVKLSEQSFNAESDVTLYASFTLNVSEKPSSGGGYFAHFRGGSSATFRGRLFIAASDDGEGFRLGISNGASSFADATVLDQAMELNRSYRIVISYEPSSATTRLGVDPTSEADLSVMAGDDASVRSIDQFGIRQTSGIGRIQMDDLKITTEFSELMTLVVPKQPAVKISNTQESLPERGGVSLPVIVQRVGGLDEVLEVEMIWSGSATADEDYSGHVSRLHFDAGQDKMEFVLEILDDALKEGPETITLSLVQAPTFLVTGSSSLTWTISDDDLTTIGFSNQSHQVREHVDQSQVFVLEREGDDASSVTVQLELGGSAERGTDYEIDFPLSITFDPGQTQMQLSIQILDDDLVEPEEHLILRVSELPSYQIEGGMIEISILSDDFQGKLVEETFSYLDGPLTEVSLGRWEHTSGDENEMVIFAGQLDVNEMQSEDVKVEIPLPSGEDVALPDALFVGMDAFFAKAPRGEGNYWMHLRGINSSSYRARLFVGNAEEGTERFKLGISNGNATADIWFPDVFVAPVRLRVVIGYRLQEAQTRLWVNPVEESGLSVAAMDETSSSSISSVSFRQPNSQAEGVGRILIDHLVVSTDFDDAVLGSSKPIVFWNFHEDPLELPDADVAVDDPVKTIHSRWLESAPRSRDLHLRRLGEVESVLWASYQISGNVDLGNDLSILQGDGPVLIPESDEEGYIQLRAKEDSSVEEDEWMKMILVQDEAYQLGYPSEAVLTLEDVPLPSTPNIKPLHLSVKHDFSGSTSMVRLVLEGEIGQAYQLESSDNLIDWTPWQFGALTSESQEMDVPINPGPSSQFFRLEVEATQD